jgi:hypothetical protein
LNGRAVKLAFFSAGPILASLLALGGCTPMHEQMTPADPVTAPAPAAAAVVVETIPFRTGVSSATVEKLARQQSCSGGQGAALVTEPGPVEVYRMHCESGQMRGQVFMARCELRQCKRM